MRFDAGAEETRGNPVNAGNEAEDRIALEQRCQRLERMVSELLLKNEELRMRVPGRELED
jgi:hypothetical protein